MGFGTLFFGYFLLLNVTYYGFTDAIAAAVMLLAFYKLSNVNNQFKSATYISLLFTVFGLVELVVNCMLLFSMAQDLSNLTQVMAMIRAVIVCTLTVVMLSGIRSISLEVELNKTPERARLMLFLTPAIYFLAIILEAEWLMNLLPPVVAPSLALVVILGTLLIAALNLLLIHSCYMHICMPEDNQPKGPKPSRFEFVNEYRRRQQQKALEEEEARKRRFEEKKMQRNKRK